MVSIIKGHYCANNDDFSLQVNYGPTFRGKMSKQIGDLIKELRTERKITQIELAQHAQVTLGTINKLENNKANVTLETLVKLLDVFGYEITAKKKEVRTNYLMSELI